MATISVLDGDGVARTVELPNANGRALAASSKPVALATEDLAAINAITTALADNATGADIASVVSALGGSLAVTGEFYPATQPVSIAATVAVSGPLTDAQLRATALPVSGTVGVSGSVAVTGEFYPATQPISGNVGVTGSVAVTGTFWQATQPVSIAAPVAVTGTFYQATQPVSAASLPLPTGAATSAKQDDTIAAINALIGTEYETVAASATNQALGATGATGDLLVSLLVIPATTSPGAITIKDGAGSAITVFAGGADSVSTLHPFSIPLGIKSGAGAWQVTTGTNVSVIAAGNFT